MTPALTNSLASLSVADLDVVQGLLRTELTSTSFSVHHQGAAYQEAFKKMEEVSRLRLEKLNLNNDVAMEPNAEGAGAVVASSNAAGK